eukprot:2113062-Prymnesium_polylepis.1
MSFTTSGLAIPAASRRAGWRRCPNDSSKLPLIKIKVVATATCRGTPRPTDSRPWIPHPLWTRRALPPSPSIDIILR